MITIGISIIVLYLLILAYYRFEKRTTRGVVSKRQSSQARRLVPVFGGKPFIIELPRLNKEVKWIGGEK